MRWFTVFRAAFYCMNEKELVEAAVSCLNSRDGALLAEQKVALFLSLKNKVMK